MKKDSDSLGLLTTEEWIRLIDISSKQSIAKVGHALVFWEVVWVSRINTGKKDLIRVHMEKDNAIFVARNNLFHATYNNLKG